MGFCLYAVPGDLDLSFGTTKTGIVITELNRWAQTNDSGVDSYGNIIAAGKTLAQIEGSFIARYTSQGILDTSFNNSGIQELYVGQSTSWSSIALLPNADIVVGGFVSNGQTDCILAKYSYRGILDPAFCPSNEPLRAHIGNGSVIRSLAITPQGDYIAGGEAVQGSGYLMILKYLNTGLLDTSFGNSGAVLTNLGKLQGSINKIIIQPHDEKIIAVGSIENGTNTQFALARYLSDGSPDTTFGENGAVCTGIEYYAAAYAVALQPDNYIVVAGFTFDEATHTCKFAIARYDTDGNLDPKFMETGVVITPVQYGARAYALVIQPDGKIIVGGTSIGNRSEQFAVVRYNNDGTLDESFGRKGIVTSSPGTQIAGINSLFLQNDTMLIAAGYADEDIALARYYTT
jgi:uncharacterized delta-60 repeat protein